MSDHSWGACILAMLFLPDSQKDYHKMYENEECDGYNKNRIINMLLVHDMAEAYTGDIPYGLKTEQDKEIEKARWNYYASLSKFSAFKNFAVMNKLWEEYEGRDSINAKIAKDIDQIESYIQLAMYKENFVDLKGMEYWNSISKEWINSIIIKTHIDKKHLNLSNNIYICNSKNIKFRQINIKDE